MANAPCRLGALGIVTALGASADAVWARLLDGEPSRLVDRDDLAPDRVLRVGAVHDPLPRIPERLAEYDCRNNAMALAALAQIEEPIARALREYGAERVGVVMGTSTSGVSSAEEAICHELREGGLTPTFDYAQLEFGGFAADYLGVRGPAYSLSTACSSGARALASARSLLALGVCDAVIAGAADSLCGLTAGGFTALSAVCDGVTNPCSVNRAGLTLGEGAAVFLVEPGAGGVQLYGVGESSEAHHMSAPDPSGAGAEVAMRGALADAGLSPDAIAYLNLHGTGTPLNDKMECLAVERVFGRALPVSSTKRLVLDRCDAGALSLPPHWWDGERDPELPALHLVQKGETAAAGSAPRVMTNSFGFGGNNCTLVLGRDL